MRDRFVHHEMRSSFAVLAVVAVDVSATTLFRDGAPVSDDGFWRILGIATAGVAFLVLVEAGRLKWVGLVRQFENAPALEDPGKEPPALVPLRHDQPVLWPVFFLYLVLSLPAALLWEPWIGVLPLPQAMQWLGKAATAARWERRHGLVLWRGGPSYLSVSPRPATRTATGAPPASPTPPAAPGVPEGPRRTPPPTT